MLSAVGSSLASGVTSTTVSPPAAIAAQIARYKKELSNCVNCESAKTSQGQADIQRLTNKISIAEARLQEIAAAKPTNQSGALDSPTASDSAINSTAVRLSAENKISDDSAAPLNFGESNTGRFVDLFV